MTIAEQAEQYREDVATFLRDMVRIKSLSSEEGDVAARIVAEMEKLGFDAAWTDDYGNVIGQIGTGPIRLVYDGHIDTVDVGNRDNWPFDPFEGKVEDGYIYGRGAGDDKLATATQVYGAKLYKDLDVHLDQFSLYVVGSVQEEDCDGLGLQYALEEAIGDVDYVCLGESTDLAVYRGHRGRVEINVVIGGVSCHASAPERGDNAIYKAMRLVADIEQLNERLHVDPFLGKGTCAVTHIRCQTPSLCAVPDGCRIHIDRRLTAGETKDLAVQQIEALPSYLPGDMRVEILHYDTPSYKGKVLEIEKYYPTWVLPEDHVLVQAGVDAAATVLDRQPDIGRWVFSTNGIASMGRLGIPTIGFAPGQEEDAHTINDRVKIDDLVSGVAFYGALPASILRVTGAG